MPVTTTGAGQPDRARRLAVVAVATLRLRTLRRRAPCTSPPGRTPSARVAADLAAPPRRRRDRVRGPGERRARPQPRPCRARRADRSRISARAAGHRGISPLAALHGRWSAHRARAPRKDRGGSASAAGRRHVAVSPPTRRLDVSRRSPRGGHAGRAPPRAFLPGYWTRPARAPGHPTRGESQWPYAWDGQPSWAWR